MSNDTRTSYECNFCNCIRKPEKSKTSQLPKLPSQLPKTFPVFHCSSYSIYFVQVTTLYLGQCFIQAHEQQLNYIHRLICVLANSQIELFLDSHRVLLMVRNKSIKLTGMALLARKLTEYYTKNSSVLEGRGIGTAWLYASCYAIISCMEFNATFTWQACFKQFCKLGVAE